MPRYKTKKLDIIQELVDTPFIDFDSCYKCYSNNGPFVWCRKNVKGHCFSVFLCEDCYEKIKREPLG